MLKIGNKSKFNRGGNNVLQLVLRVILKSRFIPCLQSFHSTYKLGSAKLTPTFRLLVLAVSFLGRIFCVRLLISSVTGPRHPKNKGHLNITLWGS